MFTKVITNLTLTNDIAAKLFKNIKGDNYRYDTSFVATLRALMYRRLDKEESILLQTNSSSYSAADVKDAKAKDCVKSIIRGSAIANGSNGVVYVHSFNNTEEQNVACFEALDAVDINTVLPGYISMADMDTFLAQKKIKARFYLNTEKNNVAIFVDRLDMKKWHLLQSFIPRYFPNHFAKVPLEEYELKLIKTLTNRYAPEYEACIEEFAGRFDFRTIELKSTLSGFEVGFEKRKLRQVQEQIRDNERRMDEVQARWSELYKKREDYTTQEIGLTEKIARMERGEGDSELLDFFLCNKSLNLVKAHNGQIEFIVTTVISSFDPEVAENAIRNKKSFIYRHYSRHTEYGNAELTDERIERLMTEILINENLKLKVCAVYFLNFADGSFGGKRHYEYPAKILAEYVPNQHIDYYACLGNNDPHVRNAMKAKDYVRAVSACCSSATNMNLTESNTGTFFMEKICDTKAGKIILMPDGTSMTPVEAVKWLEEQDKVKKQEGEKA